MPLGEVTLFAAVPALLTILLIILVRNRSRMVDLVKAAYERASDREVALLASEVRDLEVVSREARETGEALRSLFNMQADLLEQAYRRHADLRTELAAQHDRHDAYLDALDSADLEVIARVLVNRGSWTQGWLYTSSNDPHETKVALYELLEQCGVGIAAEELGVAGSWRQRIWLKPRRGNGSDGIQERLKKVEQALQVQYLSKPQSEVDKNRADAAATLLVAVDKQEEVLIRLGTLVLIKSEGKVAIWTLSELQAADLDERGSLMNDPEKMRAFLNHQSLGSGGAEHPAALPPND
jgi:hypothetical protein